MEGRDRLIALTDEYNNLIIQALTDDLSPLEVFVSINNINGEYINAEGDIMTAVNNVNSYFGWDLVGYKNGDYTSLIVETNNNLTTLMNNMKPEAYRDFVKLSNQISNLMLSGGITREQALDLVMKDYKGMSVIFSDGRLYPMRAYTSMYYNWQLAKGCYQRSAEVANIIGTNVFQVSAHGNPRVACSTVQGGLINFEGREFTFLGQLVQPASVASFGEAYGLGGCNCMHFWVPVSTSLLSFVPNVNKFIN